MTDIAFSMAQEQIKELRAEVERRDQIIKSRDDRCTRLEAEVERLQADNERLREQMDALRLVATSHEPEALRLQAEIEGLREEVAILRTTEAAEIEQLRALVKDLADDLEAELNERYPQNVRAYPSEQRRYERDMVNVYEARRALKPKP